MLKIWVSAFRPKTLTAAIVPIVVASALVYYDKGSVHYLYSVLALLGALFIQIATNLFNDAIDFKKGADTESRIGPKRITQAGEMTYKKVMGMALLFCLLALVVGVPIVLRGGFPFVIVGVVSLFLAYSYTGGPFPLAYLGLGDLFVILFFGIIAVGGVYYLHTLEVSSSMIVSGLQVGFLSTVLLAINNFRDVEQDRLANKKTLVVRFGKTFGKLEVGFLFFATLALNIYWGLNGALWAMLLPVLALPFIIKITVGVWKSEPSPIFNKFLAQSAFVQILFSLLLSLGLVIS